MSRRKILTLVCVLGLTGLLAGGALALSSGDSLISLRYLNDTFLPDAQTQMEEKMDSALQSAYDQAVSGISGGTGQGSGLSSSDFRSRTFGQGDVIGLSSGSGLLLLGGNGVLTHTGAVIDVTDGTEVSSGTALTAGHRYLVGEDTSASLTVQSGVLYLGIEGSYTYTDSGTDALPFVDVAQGDWYQSAVSYVYQNGLFSGTSADAFSPGTAMNRAMLVTVLYRLAGSPESELSAAGGSFSDVAEGSWYAPYVRWGYTQGVTAGMGEGLFAPEQSVTRQQVLVMLYSFSQQYLKRDVSGAADLTQYADGGEVAAWAQNAMAWALSNGLIVPSAENTLRPTDTASRAEVAVILMKFSSLAA